jgi:hypothetical protein
MCLSIPLAMLILIKLGKSSSGQSTGPPALTLFTSVIPVFSKL